MNGVMTLDVPESTRSNFALVADYNERAPRFAHDPQKFALPQLRYALLDSLG